MHVSPAVRKMNTYCFVSNINMNMMKKYILGLKKELVN